MKRFWIIAMALAVALLGALPAGAAKPEKPEKPPKPPASGQVGVSLDATPVWVHEDADEIKYTLTLENKTSAVIDDISVELSFGSVTEPPVDVVLEANETQELEFSRFVAQFPETCDEPEECDLVAKAKVLLGTEVMAQSTMSTPLMPYPPCKFGESQESGICIWKPGEIEDWTVTLVPTPPSNPKRHRTVWVRVRDHVPGNGCGAWSGKWWPDDGPVVVSVHLPADGVCLLGGIGGGEDFFAIGNPDSFYLNFGPEGTVTVTPVTVTPVAE